VLLPAALPDELFFSRLIRYVTMSGDIPCQFVSRLVGNSRKSIHPCLTANLLRLSAFADESPDELIRRQTLAPLFFLYHPEHAGKLYSYLLDYDSALAIRESQMPSFGSGKTTCLKGCPLCAEDDIRRCGVAYWHRAHQILGIIACYAHGVLLHRTELNMRQRILPGLLPDFRTSVIDSSSTERRVAIFGSYLIDYYSHNTPHESMSTLYRCRLAQHLYITEGGYVRRHDVMAGFYPYAFNHREGVGSPLPASERDFRYFTELLLKQGSHHPFRHLLFASWLFEEPWQLLDKQTEQVDPPDSGTEHPSDTSKVKIARERECLVLLKRGESMAAISRQTGASRCYIKRLALLHQASISCKPRIVDVSLSNQIVLLARQGIHRSTLAEHFGLSTGTIESIISATPGLVSLRKELRHDAMYRHCIEQLRDFVNKHPLALISEVRAANYSEYYWLYRYDRQLLKRILPVPTRPVGRLKRCKNKLIKNNE